MSKKLKEYTRTKGTNAADRKDKNCIPTYVPTTSIPTNDTLKSIGTNVTDRNVRDCTTKICYFISIKTTTNVLIKAPIFPKYHSR